MGFNLADFEAAAEKKYQGVVIEDIGVTLRSTLRIPDEEAEKVDELQKQLQALNDSKDPQSSKDVRHLMVELLAAVSDNAEKVREVFSSVDMAVLMVVFEEYGKVTQLAQGE